MKQQNLWTTEADVQKVARQRMHILAYTGMVGGGFVPAMRWDIDYPGRYSKNMQEAAISNQLTKNTKAHLSHMLVSLYQLAGRTKGTRDTWKLINFQLDRLADPRAILDLDELCLDQEEYSEM